MPAEFDPTRINRFFTETQIQTEKEAFNAPNWGTFRRSTVFQQLEQTKAELGDEEYKKFAEAVASDSRIKQYLPTLMLDALERQPGDPWRNAFNVGVDKNKNSAITKAEFENASNDTASFDPIFRKALKFGADNFDKLLNLDPKDGTIYGNSWSFTDQDRSVARGEVANLAVLKKTSHDERDVLESFDVIDANKSGKITNSEVWSWGRSRRLAEDAYPKVDRTKLIPTSVEVSKPEYQEMIMATEAELQRLQQFWGMR